MPRPPARDDLNLLEYHALLHAERNDGKIPLDCPQRTIRELEHRLAIDFAPSGTMSVYQITDEGREALAACQNKCHHDTLTARYAAHGNVRAFLLAVRPMGSVEGTDGDVLYAAADGGRPQELTGADLRTLLMHSAGGTALTGPHQRVDFDAVGCLDGDSFAMCGGRTYRVDTRMGNNTEDPKYTVTYEQAEAFSALARVGRGNTRKDVIDLIREHRAGLMF